MLLDYGILSMLVPMVSCYLCGYVGSHRLDWTGLRACVKRSSDVASPHVTTSGCETSHPSPSSSKPPPFEAVISLRLVLSQMVLSDTLLHSAELLVKVTNSGLDVIVSNPALHLGGMIPAVHHALSGMGHMAAADHLVRTLLAHSSLRSLLEVAPDMVPQALAMAEPEQHMACIAAPSKFLFEAVVIPAKYADLEELKWVLQVQTDGAALQVEVYENACQDVGVEAAVQLLGKHLGSLVTPMLALTAQRLEEQLASPGQAVEEDSLVSVTSSALDSLHALLPRLLGIALDIGRLCNRQQQQQDDAGPQPPTPSHSCCAELTAPDVSSPYGYGLPLATPPACPRSAARHASHHPSNPSSAPASPDLLRSGPAAVASALALAQHCLTCRAASLRHTRALAAALVQDGHLLAVQAEALRLGRSLEAQLQQLHSVAVCLSLVAQASGAEALGQEHVPNLALAGRAVLARLLQAVQQHSSDPDSSCCHLPIGGQAAELDQLCLHSQRKAGHLELCLQPPGSELSISSWVNVKAGSTLSAGARSPTLPDRGSGVCLTPRISDVGCGSPCHDSSTYQVTAGQGAAARPVTADRVVQLVQLVVQLVHDASWKDWNGEGAEVEGEEATLVASSQAALLQWQWLPLCTALLEHILAQLGLQGVPPSPALQRNLVSILQLLQLTTLAATELAEAQGYLPWRIHAGGSPAGLSLLAAVLRYCARVLPQGCLDSAPTHSLSALMQGLMVMPATLMRWQDVASPLALANQRGLKRPSNTDSMRIFTGTLADTLCSRHASKLGPPLGELSFCTQLPAQPPLLVTPRKARPGSLQALGSRRGGPGWQASVWGVACLAVASAAQALADQATSTSSRPPSNCPAPSCSNPSTSQLEWHGVGDGLAMAAINLAIPLLLRGAEEYLAVLLPGFENGAYSLDAFRVAAARHAADPSSMSAYLASAALCEGVEQLETAREQLVSCVMTLEASHTRRTDVALDCRPCFPKLAALEAALRTLLPGAATSASAAGSGALSTSVSGTYTLSSLTASSCPSLTSPPSYARASSSTADSFSLPNHMLARTSVSQEECHLASPDSMPWLAAGGAYGLLRTSATTQLADWGTVQQARGDWASSKSPAAWLLWEEAMTRLSPQHQGCSNPLCAALVRAGVRGSREAAKQACGLGAMQLWSPAKLRKPEHAPL
ncbi:hypothetical protein QJQ45_016307 [Haematococcus lacustris]|nr:hypothetical protein QJQ45_016307 [Haematococcus lacustris]